ncbi:LOW QUALITY PROTEIN: programmed cell death protein 2-like [Cyclopterus lumpus]|uniref:LOW QUALITY PROTEIN: programmed cell death protein 2-like n=1 Tax=Cyclopterus lumpus TaxID=8103 RepID=UPI00148655C0|nr:LOW QUALITY PROTEIN: programmed cell death protein 2-like [Cyclopterus lumpus]
MASPAHELTLVGLCDAEIDSQRHRSSFRTNKVGGLPDWPPGVFQKSPRCGRCGVPLAHVVQVYCPLEASPYHRNLHLFACTRAACSGRSDCWKVLRSQCLEGEEERRTSCGPPPAQEAPRSASEWCDTADDWGMEEKGVKEAAAPQTQADETDVSSRLQVLRLVDSDPVLRLVDSDPQQDVPVLRLVDSDPQQDVPVLRLVDSDPQQDVPVLRAFFINVVEEADLCGEEDELQHARRLLREYERREGVAVGGPEGGEDGGGGGEKYEKTRARHGDAVFSRFMKKISLCPQQILRYCRGGKPLFVSEPHGDAVAPPCGSCGGARTFELQLMPALVSLLRRRGGGEEAQLEFGTVLVYTCRSSCWKSGPGPGPAVEEFCSVQPDPDQHLFK